MLDVAISCAVEGVQCILRGLGKGKIKARERKAMGAPLRADVSKYRPEVYKSEKSKTLKKIHKVALGKLLT